MHATKQLKNRRANRKDDTPAKIVITQEYIAGLDDNYFGSNTKNCENLALKNIKSSVFCTISIAR